MRQKSDPQRYFDWSVASSAKVVLQYEAKYQRISQILDENPHEPRGNRVVQNVFVGVKSWLQLQGAREEWIVLERNVVAEGPSEDPVAALRSVERGKLEEIGSKPILARAVSRYINYRINQKTKTPRPEVVSDPPPRWSYYHTYDDRVWVRKGREAKKPVPYKDRFFISYASMF